MKFDVCKALVDKNYGLSNETSKELGHKINMRTKGKITFWNDEKGYGFITPSAGLKQVFVHIRAFSNRSFF